MSLAQAASTGVDGAFTSIPIVDLSKRNTPEGRLAIAHEIRDACMRVGFFYIKNHGIPQSSIDIALAAMKKYFDLPMEAKMKFHKDTNTPDGSGYSPPLHGNIAGADVNVGDTLEGFGIKYEEIDPASQSEHKTVNVWPLDESPGFRESCLQYYHKATTLAHVLFPLFALALDLPENYFDDKAQHSHRFATLRVLHYPPQRARPEVAKDAPGIGSHTDFETFTILWQQPGIQALQVMNSEGKWVDAPPIDDTLVVNIGDQLAMWTNDVFKSNVHRATNKSGQERYSIPLFMGTNYDTMIEAIPSCVSAERPAKYKPITARDYVSEQLKKMYQKPY